MCPLSSSVISIRSPIGAEPSPRQRRGGIDAVLVTDLIPEEANSWTQTLLGHGLDPIFLIAPTTSDKRLARIAQQAHGFIYAVSRAGVTGARDQMTRDAETLVKRVRSVSDLPVAVGFGISSPEQVREVWRFANAAVVGSAIVRKIENLRDSSDLVKRIGEFTRSLVARPTSNQERGTANTNERSSTHLTICFLDERLRRF